jgi:hypothetical protein
MFQGFTGSLTLLIIVIGVSTQGGSIRGKIVADIPDQRRALPNIQNNLDSRQFGTFFNSPGLSVRLKFEFMKY